MPKVGQGTENNFTKGLITEATGLNFPENAATDCDNVTFTLIGDVARRFGIDFEENAVFTNFDRTNRAVNSYKWTNAGGDGSSQILVLQIGAILSFYSITDATAASPISARKLPGVVNLESFTTPGGSFDSTSECDFADGNGYLFVYHSSCQPFYCTLIPNTGVLASPITIKIRDFAGIPEPDIQVTTRPTVLTSVHSYNLANQGWTTEAAWGTQTAFGHALHAGSNSITISPVSGISLGDNVNFYSLPIYYFPGGPVQYGSGYITAHGTVTGYSAPTLTVNITGINNPAPGSLFDFYINQTNLGFVDTWHTSQGNYPSNADVWWYFKNASGTFDPSIQSNVSLATGNAPQGHFIVDAFNIDRGTASGISGLTPVSTTKRPSTGCWFQGRVWYTGIDDSQLSLNEQPFYSWSENIYFSQVNVGTAVNFGNCFQVNDPTSENLLDILPTDGGVIQIQGSGKIYKLFPIQNGLLVFATNGVWFITGSQGIGFSATDYTVTKISSVSSFSTSSFVNVMGLPYFWNEEGIYQVAPQQGGSLSVESVTVSSIASFYDEIPVENKRFARGWYHPIDYNIQWVYRQELSNDVTERYSFDRILNYNTYNKAWYPYSVDNSNSAINGIVYIQDTGFTSAVPSTFKYISSKLVDGAYVFSLADEHDEDYVDWGSSDPKDYESFFITGYRLRGKGMSKFSNQYIYIYSRTNDEAFGYELQGLWDYANDRNSNRWSTKQTTIRNNSRFAVVPYKHKIRGHGLALQLKVNSVSGMPFDIIGWASSDIIEQGA